MMVGNNLTDLQLQQLVDRTIIKADLDFDGKISYDEFKEMVKHLDIGAKLKINKIWGKEDLMIRKLIHSWTNA